MTVFAQSKLPHVGTWNPSNFLDDPNGLFLDNFHHDTLNGQNNHNLSLNYQLNREEIIEYEGEIDCGLDRIYSNLFIIQWFQ